MRVRRSSLVLLFFFAAIAAVLAWWQYGPRTVPDGQPPLVTLDTAGFEQLRADFNRDADFTRVVLLLSPT